MATKSKSRTPATVAVNLRAPRALLTATSKAFPSPYPTTSLKLAAEAGLKQPALCKILEYAVRALSDMEGGASVALEIEQRLRKELFR